MRIIKIILLTFIILAVGLYFVYTYSMANPFKEVTWLENFPGAGDRYVEYTPVLKSDTTVKLGPTIGADYAEIRFKDLDNDGVKEAIIETETLLPHGDFYTHEKHILTFKKSPSGKFQFVQLN